MSGGKRNAPLKIGSTMGAVSAVLPLGQQGPFGVAPLRCPLSPC